MTHQDYDPQRIAAKWQKYWAENQVFKTSEDSKKPKYYVLDMFPYPSGAGLHVGHVVGYTASDILARYKRMNGYNVLHPMGWDAFGLPAEQYAIKTGTHPKTTTAKNISRFKEQLNQLGLSYDWTREINTTSPDYYKWTQWIFLQLYHKGLAYQSFEPVNWCPELGTVLANEEVVEGKSEVGGFPVIKKPMRQWVLKITEYAERLLEDLKPLDWPESIKEMQRNWIGKSVGADIQFVIEGCDTPLDVFSTRPDTLFGATFCVLAPEHPLVGEITKPEFRDAVQQYIEQTSRRSERERSGDGAGKTGAFTGAFAINPVNQDKLPIYVADYVLFSYGKGAIMAVPGHDERDHQFAKTYKLPILRVLTGGESDNIEEIPHTGDGVLMKSGFLDGLKKESAIEKVVGWLEERGFGKRTVRYRLRDWLFSRQRYWGEPFPLVFDAKNDVVPLDESDLPVLLPDLTDFKPQGTGEPPLAGSGRWLDVPRGEETLRRETNTMPQWAGSCWYYLRFIDPKNSRVPWDKEKESHWMPVDLYIGGAEHAVLHLLYARFWHKVLFDLGYVSTKEPFQKLVNQGMVLGTNHEKMSKSRGNVINPEDVIEEWGVDALRLYEMFMGPLEATKPWQTKGITGCDRFLRRIWRLVQPKQKGKDIGLMEQEHSPNFESYLHQTIKKVTEDTEKLAFNTAIASLMELVNQAYKETFLNRNSAKTIVLLLAPYAPHTAEELWERLGEKSSISSGTWPRYDSKKILVSLINYSVQVNGKHKRTWEVPKGTSEDDLVAGVRQDPSLSKTLENLDLKRTIFVQDRILNFVGQLRK